jgi:hypothetical protein
MKFFVDHADECATTLVMFLTVFDQLQHLDDLGLISKPQTIYINPLNHALNLLEPLLTYFDHFR